MSRFDRLALLIVTAVAALLRLPGIESRGRFDVDQGREMLVLEALARDGVIPLLGPRVWIGDLHHGPLHYFLLAPAAALSNGDVVAVTTFIAVLGIASVVITWWLGRAMGGPLAGFLAGTLLAVSPAAIESSTFVWNPNLVPPFAAMAFAAAWHAHQTGRSPWWTVALGAAGAVVQFHLLGAVFLTAIVALCLADLRRDRSIAGGVVAGFLVIGVLFLPLLTYEIRSGFAETGRFVAYLTNWPGAPSTPSVAGVLIVFMRVVAFPLVGLVTDAPQVAAIVFGAVLGLAIWGLRTTVGTQQTGMRWAVGIVVWSTAALALTTPSLQRVTVGFPNDHYHAYIDPFVPLIVAIPMSVLLLRAITAWRAARRMRDALAATAVGVAFAVLAGLALVRMPPRVDPDGGWPAARAVGSRITEVGDASSVLLVTLPAQRSADAVGWSVVAAGGTLTADLAQATMVVVICDQYLVNLVGQPCGGPAEDAAAARLDTLSLRLIDRFEAPRQTAISVYVPGHQ